MYNLIADSSWNAVVKKTRWGVGHAISRQITLAIWDPQDIDSVHRRAAIVNAIDRIIKGRPPT